MIRAVVEKLLLLVCILEDKVARKFLPPQNKRLDSYPFISCDTYSTHSELNLNPITVEQLKRSGKRNFRTIYLDSSFVEEITKGIKSQPSYLDIACQSILIGNSDFPPSCEQIEVLKFIANKIYSVNLPKSLENDYVRFLPLGLESRSYRSAGVLRDFKIEPDFSSGRRKIGILVAWNDDTQKEERLNARSTLRENTNVKEIRRRVPGSFLHLLMRRTMLVAAPRGNGIDTHRFWEALYLGALPVIRDSADSLPLGEWPHLKVNSWQELSDMSRLEIEEVYRSRSKDISKFRARSIEFLEALFEARAIQ